MDSPGNILTKDGIGLNVSMDAQTIVMLAASIFGAVTLGVIIGRIVTKNI